MHRSLVPASVLIVFAVLTCAAQSANSGSQSQSEPAKPAPQPQDSAPAATQAPATKTAASKDQAVDKDQSKDKKKTKKVWTNEEVANVGGTISVVGDAKAPGNSHQTTGSSGANDVAWYRNKLDPLRSQIRDLDREIQDIKNAKGSVRENVESQVRIRETKRSKIQAQIDDLEEEARRNGISAGDLR